MQGCYSYGHTCANNHHCFDEDTLLTLFASCPGFTFICISYTIFVAIALLFLVSLKVICLGGICGLSLGTFTCK